MCGGPTERGNNLSLESKLITEASSNIRNASATIVDNVGDTTDVVEHMSAGKQQDSDKGQCRPHITAIEEGLDEWER